jgi:SPP1 gp7 family putative phage head morphogenesis protein
MFGTGVPLNILGFGQNVTRNGPVDTQSDQFKEDTQELRSLLEYGDSSAYSGLRFIFDFALALAGINPMLVDYNIRWFENDNETADNRVDRVIKLRSSKPDPLISKKTALTIVSKDLGLENESAIEAELQAIKEEMDEDRQEQQTVAGDLNPEKPMTSPIDRGTVSTSGKPVTDEVIIDSKKKDDFFPLHGKKMSKIEKQFVKDIIRIHKDTYEEVKPDLNEFISKIETLRTVYNDSKDEPTPKLVEQTLELISAAIEDNKDELLQSFLDHYKQAGNYARSNVSKELGNVNITTNFINPEVQKYFLTQAGERIDGINDTTLNELRNQLYVAYTQKETPEQWEKRIESVMNCDKPKGRAEMIARTELAWAYNNSLIATYKEVGVHKVQWLAVMDNRTCPTCRDNNNQVFNLHDMPAIPAHPRCRCTLVSADD